MSTVVKKEKGTPRLRRITSSPHFLPEIDGLRFLALFLVVVQMHVPHYIDEKFFNNRLFRSSYWRNFILEGNFGVFLFFCISGFILSLPFARHYFRGASRISLKKYFLRRLTRLEPPYLVALLLCFIAQVWLLRAYTLEELWPHLMATVFYVHNWIYHDFSWVMPVAWTLEIEVHFYLLAPLLCLLFCFNNWKVRLCAYIVLIFIPIAYGVYHYYIHQWRSVANVFSLGHFFVGGLMLADAYVHQYKLVKNDKAGIILGMVTLLLFIFLLARANVWCFLGRYFSMLLFFHLTLTHPLLRKIFSLRWMTLVGGMCYAIYLVHFTVISAAGSLLLKSGWRLNQTGYVPLLILLFCAVIFMVAAFFFVAVERPFMKWGLKQK